RAPARSWSFERIAMTDLEALAVQLAPNNLDALVAQLAAKVAALLRLQEDRVLTVNEFCEWNRISKSTWFAMKRDGTGPRTIAVGTGSQERVSLAAMREWRARKEKESKSTAARLDYERRRVVNKKAAEKSCRKRHRLRLRSDHQL